MKSVIFEKDTLLDITVNLIPLGILAFFIGVFLVFNPWGGTPTLARAIQMAIVVSMFIGLAYLTYEAAVRIEGGEESEEAAH